MAVEFSAEGELAQQLKNIIGPKLFELGWSSDAQDHTLTEYVVLMLANSKSQIEIASELSKDLLSTPDAQPDASAIEFAQWLFEQIDILHQQANGASSIVPAAEVVSQDQAMDHEAPAGQDADMGDVGDTSEKSIPTGPKAMRNGNNRGSNRMFNQINRAMDRNTDPLHRVQGSSGSGRINSHSNRGNARGNKGQQIQRNFDGANRRAQQNAAGQQQSQFGFGMQNSLNPQTQQAQMLQMLEEHAKMMAQMAAQGGFMNPAVFGSQGFGNGKQGFNRNNKSQGRQNKNFNHNKGASKDADTAMGDDAHTGDASEEPKDQSQIMCKFNLFCTKADCLFAHQSPAAPPGVQVDTSSECPYGAACKNHKCVARHPSPAKKADFQQQQECKFGPYCQNSRCPFKHSNAKACRNGADCTTEGCTYFHSTIECKFNPCTNPACYFKHKDGQKANGGGNTWKVGGDTEKSHISERKFVDEGAGEEVIIPGSQNVEAEPMAS